MSTPNIDLTPAGLQTWLYNMTYDNLRSQYDQKTDLVLRLPMVDTENADQGRWLVTSMQTGYYTSLPAVRNVWVEGDTPGTKAHHFKAISNSLPIARAIVADPSNQSVINVKSTAVPELTVVITNASGMTMGATGIISMETRIDNHVELDYFSVLTECQRTWPSLQMTADLARWWLDATKFSDALGSRNNNDDTKLVLVNANNNDLRLFKEALKAKDLQDSCPKWRFRPVKMSST